MIKKKDIEKAIVTAEVLQGDFLVFANSTQDPPAKAMFQAMADDTTGHLQQLYEQRDRVLFSQWVAKAESKGPRLRNAAVAFVTGGAVCAVGEALTDVWQYALGISHIRAEQHTVVTLIFLAALMTGLGWFDDAVRFAGAGLTVPVAGFANAMTASALEFKREGLVYGVGSRMFQLAGSVIVFGVVTAMAVGVIASLSDLFVR